MRPILTLILAAFLPISALASDTAPAEAADSPVGETPAEAVEEGIEEAAEELPPGLQFIDASEVSLDAFLWESRLVLVLADAPNNPQFLQQIRYLEERADEMLERDVIVIVDTDPAARSDARQRLRPRGFMLAIIDKDGEVKQRRPAPRTGREIMAVIDRFPLRRQEMLERAPSGRE